MGSIDTFLIVIVASFLLTVITGPFFIPFLRRLKFGQSIREEGPQSHMKKAGTPTMGGLMIIISTIIAAIVVTLLLAPEVVTYHFWLLLFLLFSYGLIGFLDDFIIILTKTNKGLTSKQKLFAQILVAVIFYVIILLFDFPTYIAIPATGIEIELGYAYGLLVIFMIVGASNAVNLTDGLDGLLGGTASIAFAAFGILAAYNLEQVDITLFSLATVGALLGFLVFNAHPAKVFMGDTGSLALGAAIAGIAILTKQEILLIIIGGIFVIETLSVIIQVISFKTRGKRIFLMSPLHHHYELKGWSEWRVVITFWAAGAVLAIIGVYIGVGLA